LKLAILYDEYFEKPSESELKALEDEAPGVAVSCCAQWDLVDAADIADAEVLFGRAPPGMLKGLKHLKWHHLASAGANKYTDHALYADPSIILTKSSGTFGVPIAEHVLGMMIALSRNFTHHYKNQLEGAWRQSWLGTYDIFASNVLVLGLGDIGTEVCRRLSGFGCNITGFRHNPSAPHELVSDVRPISRLRESLPEADYIIICLPGTVEARNLIGREEFALMKRRAIVINIGRGFIIDTDALVDALNTNTIGGAGLDVTDPEPLPAGHPLWSAKNTIITPHESASSNLTSKRRLAIFTDLLKRYMNGQPMYNTVDFNAGY